MSHEKLVRRLAADIVGAALATCTLIALSRVAPDWMVGVTCVLIVPALVVGIFAWAAARGPMTDTDRYCAAVDAELDEAESRRRDHDTAFLTSPDRDVSRASSERGPGSRQPISTAAESNPFVVTAYVDLSWAIHDTSLHSYRVTRPDR